MAKVERLWHLMVRQKWQHLAFFQKLLQKNWGMSHKLMETLNCLQGRYLIACYVSLEGASQEQVFPHSRTVGSWLGHSAHEPCGEADGGDVEIVTYLSKHKSAHGGGGGRVEKGLRC